MQRVGARVELVRGVEVVSRERQAAAGRTLERVALAKVVVVGLF